MFKLTREDKITGTKVNPRAQYHCESSFLLIKEPLPHISTVISLLFWPSPLQSCLHEHLYWKRQSWSFAQFVISWHLYSQREVCAEWCMCVCVGGVCEGDDAFHTRCSNFKTYGVLPCPFVGNSATWRWNFPLASNTRGGQRRKRLSLEGCSDFRRIRNWNISNSENCDRNKSKLVPGSLHSHPSNSFDLQILGCISHPLPPLIRVECIDLGGCVSG